MFQKVFEYAGPHKKGLYAATAIVLVSVLKHPLSFCAWFLSWRVWCCKPFSMAGD